ncbi:MAG: hypothetical protein PHW04_16120 [Candidatus Wallbacteria bacterium]|nr:hypothetical protein [Candidatus Wallbacteria bacterium]
MLWKCPCGEINMGVAERCRICDKPFAPELVIKPDDFDINPKKGDNDKCNQKNYTIVIYTIAASLFILVCVITSGGAIGIPFILLAALFWFSATGSPDAIYKISSRFKECHNEEDCRQFFKKVSFKNQRPITVLGVIANVSLVVLFCNIGVKNLNITILTLFVLILNLVLIVSVSNIFNLFAEGRDWKRQLKYFYTLLFFLSLSGTCLWKGDYSFLCSLQRYILHFNHLDIQDIFTAAFFNAFYANAMVWPFSFYTVILWNHKKFLKSKDAQALDWFIGIPAFLSSWIGFIFILGLALVWVMSGQI